jgi:uncharacterized protein (DUF924 family)
MQREVVPVGEGAGQLRPRRVLEVWFGGDASDPLSHAPLWFSRDAELDRGLREEFEPHIHRAANGDYDAWRAAPGDALAFIILLDQFSRNIYRDTARSFAQDAPAREICLTGMERGFDLRLPPVRASFFYMPLMHAEDLEMQRLSVAKFEALPARAKGEVRESLEKNHAFAVSHMEVIEQFGRFPHRNAILGRESSSEELAYLSDPDAGF